MKTWIGVLDCNNFFVSCERLFRPDLRQKPVVVLSSNDGCVVARSQEIKDINVPMGVPYFKIKDILKKADSTTFSSHFALYRDISRRVFEVMRTELDEVEQYSVDEAFFRFTGTENEVYKLACKVKTAVELQVGIPVSIGVAHSKTQAKYANFLAKKGQGIEVVGAEKWLEMTPDVPLARLWGVGKQFDIQYKKHGLVTVEQLLKIDDLVLAKLFGVVGVRLKKELLGVAVYDLFSKREVQQSIMSSRSFKEATMDLAVVLDAVAYHVRHAVADLRAMERRTACVVVHLGTSRYGDFVMHSRSKKLVLTTPTNDTLIIMKQVQLAVAELFEAGVPYNKVGVTLSQFTALETVQGSLFGAETESKSQSLMEIADGINKLKNQELVLFGSRLLTKKWQARNESQSPSYTTDWKDVAVVKAR